MVAGILPKAETNGALKLPFVDLTRYRRYHAENKPRPYYASRACFTPIAANNLRCSLVEVPGTAPGS
jgi:hypothetical protein